MSKKFGLKEALRALQAKPDMNRDGATTGLAFLAAMGTKVRVVKEVEDKIKFVENLQKGAEKVLTTAAANLDTLPKNAESAVNVAKVDTQKVVTVLQTTAKGKVAQIEARRDAKISAIEKKAGQVVDKVTTKLNKEETGARTQMNAKIAAVKQETDAQIAATRETIEEVRTQMKDIAEALAKMAQVKALFS